MPSSGSRRLARPGAGARSSKRANVTPRSSRPDRAAARRPSRPRSRSRRRAGRRRRPRCSARFWADARSETWSQRADARLARSGQAAVFRRAQDWLARGMVLFDRHQNEASEAAFAAALEDRGTRWTPAGECKARFHLAQSVWKAAQPHPGGAVVRGGRAGLPAGRRRRHPRPGPLPARALPGQHRAARRGQGGVRPGRDRLPRTPAGRRRPPARRRIGLGGRGRRRRRGAGELAVRAIPLRRHGGRGPLATRLASLPPR